MIRLRNIAKSYRLGPVLVDVLHGVSLEVAAGDLLSITGPSGCGKSTLLNILGLLDQPSSGTYALNARDISSLDDDAVSAIRNANIGFVFQSFHLLPRMTAVENASLPLVYRRLPEAEVRERALASLDQVGMADRAGHMPNELSGGQQQRVAVARAIIGDPGFILADEPTGALDPETGREVMDIFESLSDKGIAVVIVTHDAGIAERCARQTRIDSGTLQEDARVWA